MLTSASIENIRTVFEFIDIGLDICGYKKSIDYNVKYDTNKNPKEIIFY